MVIFMDCLLGQLAGIVGSSHIKTKEPMRLHTTFRTGGPADYFVTPQNEETLAASIAFCKKNHIPFYVIGNGSNLLVSDEGFRGVILQLAQNQNAVEVRGRGIRAQAGALLSAVANAALSASLTGFEFAAGIPGTIGGACVMNAGAYGGELKDVLVSVRALDKDGQIRSIPAEEMEFGYRTSRIAARGEIVLSAEIRLAPGIAEEIRARMQALAKARREKQPLEYGSAGSTFKRPEGYFAGKLIQDAGLQGFQIGGAAVSEKHCGFVINKDNATSADIYRLIRHIRQEVQKQFGVELQPEVRMLGSFS